MNIKEKRIRNEKQKNKYNNKKTNHCYYYTISQANMDCVNSY